jgi:Sugar (and other) transporter
VAITYYMEICPFSLRAKGSQLYSLSGALASLFNNYVNPIAMAAISWKYYIVWDIWLFCMVAIVYFGFPETHGKSLEEVAEVFGDAMIDSEVVFQKHQEV